MVEDRALSVPDHAVSVSVSVLVLREGGEEEEERGGRGGREEATTTANVVSNVDPDITVPSTFSSASVELGNSPLVCWGQIGMPLITHGLGSAHVYVGLAVSVGAEGGIAKPDFDLNADGEKKEVMGVMVWVSVTMIVLVGLADEDGGEGLRLTRLGFDGMGLGRLP